MRKVLTYFLLLAGLQSVFAQNIDTRKATENVLIEAVTIMEGGDLQRALSIFQMLEKNDPQNDAVAYYIGVCNYTMGNNASAKEAFEKALSLDPSNDWYKESLATVCIALGENDRVVRIFEELVESNPKIYRTPYTLCVLGDQAYYDRNDSLAVKYYEEAMLYQPGYPPATLGLAEVYRVRGNMPAYLAQLSQVVKNPDIDAQPKVQYLENLFNHVDQNFYRAWHSQLDSLVVGTVQANPTDSTALKFAGRWFYGTDRKEEGKAWWKKWSDLYPLDFDAYLFQMEICAIEGDTQEALAKCDTLLNLATTTEQKVRVYSTMGDSCYQLGDGNRAFSYYEKALKLNPNFAPVLNNYAYYLSMQGRKLSKAARMSRITVEQDPDNPTYLDTYGWILFLQHKYQEAKVQFKHAMIFGGKDSKVILEHYADVLEVLGETDVASHYRSLAKGKEE